MNHTEAKAILERTEGDPPVFSRDMDTVTLYGEYTIEELQAMLQLMEYTA